MEPAPTAMGNTRRDGAGDINVNPTDIEDVGSSPVTFERRILEASRDNTIFRKLRLTLFPKRPFELFGLLLCKGSAWNTKL